MVMRKQISGNWVLICLLALCVAFGMLIQTSVVSAEETGGDAPYYYDGTYQGTAYGYRSNVTVEITIANNELADIAVISQAEDAAYWKKAVKILDSIKEAKSLEVDTISGATVSSVAILEAARNALDQALTDPNSPFVSGDGSEASPYVIATPAKLAQFAETVDNGETYEGKYVVLKDDMDLSSLGKWNPIGLEADKAAAVFNGTFNGNGHVISGMKITGKYTEAANVGLFAALGANAVIEDVHMEGVNIKVKGTTVLRAGSIAGDVLSGAARINNCSVQGSVDVTSTGAALVFAGGLTGRALNGAILANSWTEVSVEAASQGGSNSAYAGGLAGTTGKDSVIVNNAVFGEESASSPVSTNFGGMAGGLTAMAAGYVYNNYALGDASIVSGETANTWVGALAGQVTVSGMVKDTDDNRVYPETGALRDFNYFPKEAVLTYVKAGKEGTVSPATAAGTGSVSYDTLFTGSALSAAEMQDADFADTMNDTLSDAAGLLQAYGIDISLNTWEANKSLATPTGSVFKGAPTQTSEGTAIFATGKGSKKNPFVIATADQLRAFAASVTADNNYSKQYVKLGADIDLSGSQWTPVGSTTDMEAATAGGFAMAAFNGNFDGAGYTIKGMTIGTEDDPVAITSGKANVIGFFCKLGSDAVVKNVNMTDAYMNVSSTTGLQAGILSGYSAYKSSSDYEGAVVNSCYVDGTVNATCSKGNAFVGALIGRQEQGAVINCVTNGTVVCEDTAAWSECGAIVGMNNGGLVANSCSWGSLEAKTGADNAGYSMGSLIAGYQGGDIVNCYAAGALSTNDKTNYSGILSGWMRGYARTYNSWYNKDQTMTMAGEVVDPVKVVGIWPTAYADEAGEFYIGGLTDELNGYNASSMKALASGLNSTLELCPVDIEQYGLSQTALKAWTYDADAQAVVLTDTAAEYSYMRPDCEVVPQTETVYNPGTWYGRSDDKTAIVAITINENKVKNIEVIEGDASGDAYDEAAAKAMEKALYGDPSTYNEADTSMFAGGSGTAEDPYQISNEAQLRYLAESINEDVDWEGVYFRQTANITLEHGDWTPIGWGIMAEIKSSKTVYSQYPFRGCYDGGDFLISGLTIGTADTPSTDPRCGLTAGLFGIVEGEEQTNDTPQDPETRYVDLTNIHLENVDIHVATTYDCYAGALAGDPELGFHAVNCSAEGIMDVTSEKGSIYMGGLMGYPLRGLIENCWTNIESGANAEKGTVYLGGLCGMDNRVTTVNSFTTGSVKGDGENVAVGGLSGDFAGLRYNCYTAADVESAVATDDIGAVNGIVSGIGAETGVYYSSSVKLTAAGEAVEVKGNGSSAAAQAQAVETAQDDMGAALAEVLNTGITTAQESLTALHTEYGSINHHGHGMYYAGDNSDLYKWAVNAMNITAFDGKDATPGASAINKVKAMKVSDVKVKAKKGKKAKVTWTALGDGYTYEVYTSRKANKGFKKAGTTAKTKLKVKKLKAKKTYYVMVRGCTTVNGQKVYTGYSDVVKFKAKK